MLTRLKYEKLALSKSFEGIGVTFCCEFINY
jgi:hypothetical protein